MQAQLKTPPTDSSGRWRILLCMCAWFVCAPQINASQLVFSHEAGMPVFLEDAAYELPAAHLRLGPEAPCNGIAR